MTRRFLIAMLVIAPSLALAEAPQKERVVGILDVRAPNEEVEAQFEQSLEQQLDTNEYWLAPRAKMRERLRNSTKWTHGCFVGACLTEAKVQTNADIVILAALEGAGTSFGFVVTLVRTDNGRVFLQASERCDVCTLTEVMTKATLATIELLNKVPDKLPDDAAQQRIEHDLALEAVDKRHATKHRRHRRTAMIATISGLVLAATGTAVYLLRDRDEDGFDVGVATGAAGVGLAAGGIVALTF